MKDKPTRVSMPIAPQPTPAPATALNPAPGLSSNLVSNHPTNPSSGSLPDADPGSNLDPGLNPDSAPNPTTGLTPNPNQTPTPTPTSISPISDGQNSGTHPEKPQKKKHTGLVAGIIIALIVLIGGGAFTTYAIIKNQPDNIAAESFSNLINANRVAISGTYNYTPKNSQSDIGSVIVTIDSKTADVNASSDIHASISLPSIDKTIELDLGEVTLKDGVFYSKVNGVTKMYEDVLDEMIEEYLYQLAETTIRSSRYRTCYSHDDYDGYQNCRNEVEAQMANSPTTAEEVANIVSEVKSTIMNIIKKIDDQWLEYSIKDILGSEYLSDRIDQSTKDSIMKTYNCSVEKTNNLSQYSNEFSELYSNHRFVKLNPESDSFYRVLFDVDNLTNFINALPETRVYSEYTSCIKSDDISGEILEVSADDVRRVLDDFPGIYAKFDGFLNHHLTELKIVNENESDTFSASLDLKFTYPSDINIAAPRDSRPIMDLVQDIDEDITNLYQKIIGQHTLN